MKHTFALAFLVTSIILVAACTSKKSEKETAAETTEDTVATNPVEWAMMDEFHWVMAESFHPYMDSGNLAPAKRLAGEMAAKAGEWAQSTLPEKVDNEETKNLLTALQQKAATFAQQVTNEADDETIGNALTAIHDDFHAVQEVWYSSEEDEHTEH